MVERWQVIPGFEGYEVSSIGQVRSVPRTIIRSDGRSLSIAGCVLQQNVNPKGYPRVGIHGRQHFVHILMLTAFVGPRPPGKQGCHENDQPADNWIENLRWDTPSANRLDSVRNGTHHEARKMCCPREHALRAPNLVPSQEEEGDRACRACSRARAECQRLTARGIDLPDFKTLADRHYRKIMEAA